VTSKISQTFFGLPRDSQKRHTLAGDHATSLISGAEYLIPHDSITGRHSSLACIPSPIRSMMCVRARMTRSENGYILCNDLIP
jgi:hypothetical protein